jgi:beta-lactamase regulating signal transducer with metallopeptidase domain
MLLPATAVEWDADRRALVLSHEAAHLRRNDCWALLAAESACALFWLNPLVWIAASELRREQEHAADDEVLNAGADPTTYAGHLVALARAGRPPILAAGAISRSQLTGRVEAILDPRRVRRMPTRTMILATVLVHRPVSSL